MKLKIVTYTVCVMVVFWIPVMCHSQSDSTKYLLNQLKLELFQNSENQILLYKLIKCEEEEAFSQKIDSTKMVRANQPDPHKTLDLLKKIMFTKDYTCMDELMKIYEKQLQYFLVEWSQVYKDNYYACYPVREQFQILSGFETVLKSLDIAKKKMKPEQVFKMFFNDYLFVQNYLRQIDSRCELIKKYKDVSKLYRSFKPCNILADGAPYSYIDPFFSELKPFFLSILFECKWQLHPYNSINDSCRFWFDYSSYFYSRIKDERVYKHYMKYYNSIEQGGYSTPLYMYAATFFDTNFSNFLIGKWIDLPDSIDTEHSNTYSRSFQIGKMLVEQRNFPLLMNQLINLAETNPEKAMKLIKYIPYGDLSEYTKNKILILSRMRSEMKMPEVRYKGEKKE